MDFIDLVKQRQSVRKYSSRPVSESDLNKCIEAARLAPSASNSQPWKFIIVDEPELRMQIADATATRGLPINNFAKQAPILLIIVIERPAFITRMAGKIKNKDFEWTDLGITAEHFCLQATELGLGTCMIGWFNENKIMELLGVPDSKRIGLVITLGYPSDGYSERKKVRKQNDKIIARNKWVW